jgi:tetratricopeptide (TPR) repeat protein
MGKEKTNLCRDVMIKTVSKLFPNEGWNNPACWPECEALTPHAETLAGATADDSDAWLALSLLLNNMGSYHHGRAAYTEAEILFRRVLAICEMQLGLDHPNVGRSLNNLALLLKELGKYTEAEPLLRRALAIDENAYGKDHPCVATNLNNLAFLLTKLGKYTEAEPLSRRAVAIWEKSLGSESSQHHNKRREPILSRIKSASVVEELYAQIFISLIDNIVVPFFDD